MHDNYISYSTYATPQTMQLTNKSCIHTIGEGTVLIATLVDGRTCHIQVENVIHAPDLSNSLLSMKVLNQCGLEVQFKDGIGQVVNSNGDVLARSNDGGSLYNLHTLHVEPNTIMASIAQKSAHLSLDLIHWHLGHPSVGVLRKMLKKGLVKGVVVYDLEESREIFCDACLQAKMTSSPFQSGHHHASRCCDHVHSDLCGEFEHLTLGRNLYFATLIDNMSGRIWVKLMKHKSDFITWFIEMDTLFVNQYAQHVRTLCTDNGGEYINQHLHDYCSAAGIVLELTIPHTPQQNGVAE